MPTKLRSLSLSSTLAVAGATTLATLALTGNFTTDGNLTVAGTMSGATLHTSTGIVLGDTDGAGCSNVYTLNGAVTSAIVACP